MGVWSKTLTWNTYRRIVLKRENNNNGNRSSLAIRGLKRPIAKMNPLSYLHAYHTGLDLHPTTPFKVMFAQDVFSSITLAASKHNSDDETTIILRQFQLALGRLE